LLVLIWRWRVTARLWLRLLIHLVHLLIDDHLISLICYVSGILAPVPKTTLPQALQLPECLSKATLISVEHTLVSSFLVDTAKSSKTTRLILMNMGILLVLPLQLFYHPLNDVSVERVYFDLRLLFHVLVLHWQEIWLIIFLMVRKVLGAILLNLMVWLKLLWLIIIMMTFHS